MLSLIKLRFCCPPTELDTVLYPANAFGQHALQGWVATLERAAVPKGRLNHGRVTELLDQ
jgi:hypothetical protein